MQKEFNRRVLIGVLLIAVIALIAGVCASPTVRLPVSRYHMTRPSDLYLPLGDTPYWKVKVSSAWANEPWTGDDAPYQQIERDADKSLTSSWSVRKLLEQSSTLARQNPTDPQAQFRWSYMARQVVQAQSASYDWSSESEAISVILARAVSPKTYSYARLRFLEEDQNPALTELGERLLQRDPNDVSVKYELSIDYSALFSERSQQTHEVDPKLKQRALSLAAQLIAADPSNPRYHGNLAAVYVSSWVDRRNPEDATKAIAAYRDFLRLAPVEDNSRSHRLAIIAMLQQYLSENPMPQQ